MPYHESTNRNIKKNVIFPIYKKFKSFTVKPKKIPFIHPLPIFDDRIHYRWPILFMEFGWS